MIMKKSAAMSAMKHGRTSSLWLLLLVVWTRYSVVLAAQEQSKTQSSAYAASPGARRERNLDHWDADTLAHYLGVDATTGEKIDQHEYPGHDAVIMFYAQWCPNCHALAPSIDAIATHLHAGKRKSRLIVSLFDCEADMQHALLCSVAGVEHYPTLLFMGAGTYHDSDFITRTLLKKKGNAAPLPHTTKYPGQAYPDAILDWIRLMQGLSRWHRWTSDHGVLRVLRNGLLGLLRPSSTYTTRPKDSDSLPVGIPGNFPGSSIDTGPSSTLAMKSQVTDLEDSLKVASQKITLLEKATTYQGALMETLLFSLASDSLEDVFGHLTNNTGVGWKTEDPVLLAQRTCLMDLSMDYCGRFNNRIATEIVETEVDMSSLETLNMSRLEETLKQRLEQREPYCAVFEACLENDFTDSSCRPTECPFQEPSACRYVRACWDSEVQRVYGMELQLIQEGDVWPPKKHAQETFAKKKSGWGF